MEERIIKIFEDINEDILTYDGENMLEAGIITSFEMIAMITELEKEFNIKIEAEYINAHHFSNKNTIINMVNEIIHGK